MKKGTPQIFIWLLLSIFFVSCVQQETWDTLSTKGRKAQQANNLIEAEHYFLRALDIAQGPPDNDKQLSHSFFRLAMLYHYSGYYQKADYYYRHTLDLDKRLYGSSDRRVATILNNFANVRIRQGQFPEAQPFLTEEMAIWKELGELENMVYITSLVQQAIVYREEERWTEAENLFQNAINISEQVKGVDRGLAWDQWGLLYEKKGNLSKALILYTQAVDWHETHYGPSDPELAKSLTFLGSLALKQDKLEEAKLHLRRAMTIQEKIFGAGHPDLAITLERYAQLLRMEGKDEEALKVEGRIQFMNEHFSKPFVPPRTTPLSNAFVPLIGDHSA